MTNNINISQCNSIQILSQIKEKNKITSQMQFTGSFDLMLNANDVFDNTNTKVVKASDICNLGSHLKGALISSPLLQTNGGTISPFLYVYFKPFLAFILCI